MLLKSLLSFVVPAALTGLASAGSSGHGDGKGNTQSGPFYLKISDTQHVIGNDLWNITIGPMYGTKLFYKKKDIVGNAVGHYVSYSKRRPAVWNGERLTRE
jgi:hypothetical protein